MAKKEEVNIIKQTTENVINATIDTVVKDSVEKILPILETQINSDIALYLKSPEYKERVKEAIQERVIDRCIEDIDDGEYDDELESIFTKKEKEKYTSFVGRMFEQLLTEKKVQDKIKSKLIEHYIDDIDEFCTLSNLLQKFFDKNPIEVVLTPKKEKKVKNNEEI